MSDTISFNPAVFEMAAGETQTLSFDFAAQLTGAEQVQSAVCALTNLVTGAAFAAGLSGSPTVSGGDTVIQAVSGLTAGTIYRLTVTATISLTHVSVGYLDIRCLAL